MTQSVATPTDDEVDSEVSYDCRILVVDDHEMIRVGLHALLVAQPWVDRCVGAGSLDRALELTERYKPHLALVDLFVGEESGVGLCKRLLEKSPNTSVVLMSGVGSVSPAVAQAAGASGFVPKDWPARTLLDAIRRASEGRRVYPRRARVEPRVKLTRREQDVLGHLVHGLSNVQIAEKLHLSRHTVKQHTCAVYRKLDAKNRAEAASRAQQLGVVR